MREIKFILLIPQCVLCHIWAFLIPPERIQTAASMNGPSGILAGHAERCYIVFKKITTASTPRSPNITDTKGSQKRE